MNFSFKKQLDLLSLTALGFCLVSFEAQAMDEEERENKQLLSSSQPLNIVDLMSDLNLSLEAEQAELLSQKAVIERLKQTIANLEAQGAQEALLTRMRELVQTQETDSERKEQDIKNRTESMKKLEKKRAKKERRKAAQAKAEAHQHLDLQKKIKGQPEFQ